MGLTKSEIFSDKQNKLAGMMKAAPNLGTTGEYLVHCFGRYEFTGIKPKLPDVTFNGRLERRVGNKIVELIEVGPAHTGGDTLAYVAKDRTIFTGDILFVHGHPIIWAGPVANWIAVSGRRSERGTNQKSVEQLRARSSSRLG